MRGACLNKPAVAAIYCCPVKMVNETVESVSPYTNKTDNFAVTETGCPETRRPDSGNIRESVAVSTEKSMNRQNGQY